MWCHGRGGVLTRVLGILRNELVCQLCLGVYPEEDFSIIQLMVNFSPFSLINRLIVTE